MKRFRLLALLWVLGTASLLVTKNAGQFHWIGLSRMDIFNEKSLRAAGWRVVYFRGDRRLPFMDSAGNNLAWMDDENFKYRTYMMMSYFLGEPDRLSAAQLQRNWQRIASYLLKPVLYDFCHFESKVHPYTIEISHSVRSGPPLRLEWTPGAAVRRRCPGSTWRFFFRDDSREHARSPLASETITLTTDGGYE